MCLLTTLLTLRRILIVSGFCFLGEFGSVREAFLKSENNSGQKVAVKVLKSKCTFKMIG